MEGVLETAMVAEACLEALSGKDEMKVKKEEEKVEEKEEEMEGEKEEAEEEKEEVRLHKVTATFDKVHCGNRVTHPHSWVISVTHHAIIHRVHAQD